MLNITEPTLLLDEKRCKANIRKMVDKTNALGLGFRPHFKTHQSRTVGRWFREQGVTMITVSSLGMAKYFAEDGWDDITVAFPANILKINEINALASKIKLTLLLDNAVTAQMLSKNLSHQIDVFIEIDAGSGRTGIEFNCLDELKMVADSVDASPNLNLKGFYTHAGHSYQSRSKVEIMNVMDSISRGYASLKAAIGNRYPDVEYCMGDTPTCSVATVFEHVDALSPGNFVFYDVMQVVISSCQESEIAAVMACPIVSKNKHSKQICIYGGAIHFSKDSIAIDGQMIFGKVVRLTEKGWSPALQGCYVKGLSQEHGIIQLTPEAYKEFNIGDVLGVLPIHSCLAAEAIGGYKTLEGKIIDHYAKKNRDEARFS